MHQTSRRQEWTARSTLRDKCPISFLHASISNPPHDIPKIPEKVLTTIADKTHDALGWQKQYNGVQQGWTSVNVATAGKEVGILFSPMTAKQSFPNICELMFEMLL